MQWLILEAKLLWRARMVRWLLIGYLGISLLAVGFGGQRLQQERVHQQQVQADFNEQISQWHKRGEHASPGYMAYYLKAPAVFTPSPWAALVRGERDESPKQLRMGLLAAQGQIYASELNNHDLLQIGVLDLAFIWIYLLPLLVGVLCVNSLAGEQESGRWPILAAQLSTFRFVLQRLGLRFGLCVLVTSLLFVAVSVMAGLRFDGRWFGVLTLLLVYQLFWATVALAIISLRMHSVQNTMSYVGVWLVLGFLVPGMAYLSQMHPQDLNTGIALMVEQRQHMHDSWDRDKPADLDVFLQKHPQWADTAPMEGRFDWKWYYAMQQMSDENVADLAAGYAQRRTNISNATRVWRWLSPPLNLQFALTRAANTDAVAHQDYLDQVVAWHNEMSAFWYPYFFFDEPFTVDATSALPTFEYQQRVPAGLTKPLWQLLAVIGILVALVVSMHTARRRREGRLLMLRAAPAR